MKHLLARFGIHSKEEFWKLFKQFFQFGIVGISNTAISLAIYYLIIWIRTDWYMAANVLGWAVSVLNAFYWGNRVVFKQEDNAPAQVVKRLLKSYASYGFSFLLTWALLYAEVQFWGWSEWIAPLVNLLVSIPLNFIINKFWTFKP